MLQGLASIGELILESAEIVGSTGPAAPITIGGLAFMKIYEEFEKNSFENQVARGEIVKHIPPELKKKYPTVSIGSKKKSVLPFTMTRPTIISKSLVYPGEWFFQGNNIFASPKSPVSTPSLSLKQMYQLRSRKRARTGSYTKPKKKRRRRNRSGRTVIYAPNYVGYRRIRRRDRHGFRRYRNVRQSPAKLFRHANYIPPNY